MFYKLLEKVGAELQWQVAIIFFYNISLLSWVLWTQLENIRLIFFYLPFHFSPTSYKYIVESNSSKTSVYL